MKKRLKFANLITQVFRYAFIIVLLFIIANMFIFSDSTEYYTKKVFLLSNRSLFILSLVFCILLYFLIKERNKKASTNKQAVYWVIIASIFLFILQMVIVSNMFFYTGWDAGGVRDSVFEIINGTNKIWYPYSRFPGNINITAVMVVIAKISKAVGVNEYLGILIVNVLFVNLAGLFTYLCAYKITNSVKISKISWLLFSLLVSLSPWISVPYADTFSIFLPILILYLYIAIDPDKKMGLKWFSIGFLSFYGATIRKTVLVVLIAIIVVETLKAFTQMDKKIWVNILLSLVLVGLSIFPVMIIGSLSDDLLGVEINDEESFSIYHLAMMGLNEETNGVFSQEDIDFSASFKTIEERNEKNLEVIEKRLRDFGFFGYLKFLGEKSLVIFSDGSFAWGVEGDFYQSIPERSNGISTFLKEIYYNDGSWNPLLLTFQQIIWFVILLLLPLMGILGKQPESNRTVLMLAIIGLVVALLIFEARARYIYHYTPLFVLGASIGLGMISKKVNHKPTDLINVTEKKQEEKDIYDAPPISTEINNQTFP